jgi:UDP-GlcNAc:undecaprenyl-phosphate GlcNAc-1-phosphate transferase
MPSTTIYCLNAFLLSVVAISLMLRLAPRIGLVDVPNERKHHEGRIPLVGSGLFIAVLIAALLLPGSGKLGWFLLSMALIVLVGIVDDLIDLRAGVKFALQCAVVTVMVLPGGVLVQNAGVLIGGQPFLLLNWAAPVTIFAVVGMVNAINLIDGLDGLAGGVSFVALLWLAVAAILLGKPFETLLILVFAFGILGFLAFNFRLPWRTRAAGFLGDAGSMMLGLALSYAAITLTQSGGHDLPATSALWICALPVIDTLSLIVRRSAAGKSISCPDSRHLHELLRNIGWSVSQTVIILIGISAALGAVGVAGWLLGVPDRIMLLGLLIPAAAHSCFIRYGTKQRRGGGPSAVAVTKASVLGAGQHLE